jgi:hypothetical protein
MSGAGKTVPNVGGVTSPREWHRHLAGDPNSCGWKPLRLNQRGEVTPPTV